MLKSFLVRFSEPSSWAGLSGLALTVGISAPLYSVATTFVAATCGLIAFVVKEKTA